MMVDVPIEPGIFAPPVPWRDEEVAQLRRMWAAGCTGGEIALATGRARNAVIGKARRLGLKPRPSPIPGRG